MRLIEGRYQGGRCISDYINKHININGLSILVKDIVRLDKNKRMNSMLTKRCIKYKDKNRLNVKEWHNIFHTNIK